MNELTCAHCGESRLVDVIRVSAGGTKLLYCRICGRESVLFPACPQCGEAGTHTDTCPTLQKAWGV